MSFKRKLFTILYPERCPYCDTIINACELACESCYEELCRKHQPIPSGARGFRCISSFVYDGKVRRMILRLKYHDHIQHMPQIAVILAEDIRKVYGENAFDLVTCVPMHKKDLKKRGFNQSEKLAKALSRQLNLPFCETLHKIRQTQQQHTLPYAERKKNLNGAFALIDQVDLTGQRILIVDDIITSGYTLGNCCRVLSKAKPALICCVTIASAQNKYPASTVI